MRSEKSCLSLRKSAWGIWSGTLLLLIGLAATSAVRAAESFAESPFSKPAFAASPAELLEWANKCDYDLGRADVEILLDDVRYRIDAEGKTTTTTRQIYRCLTREAPEENGIVDALWTPWHQDRPTIQGRVITPDGKVHLLDANTIEEVQIPSRQANVFTDIKLLRAPLPALNVGSVIETEVITREHRPFSTAGGSNTYQLGSLTAPTRHVHVVLEVPSSAPVKYRVVRSEVAPDVKQEGDFQVITLLLGPVPALADQYESNLPGDIAPVPLFAYSTSPSWHAVASEYAAVVEQKLADSDLREVVRGVLGPGEGKSPREIAEWLLDFVTTRTRYTAVSFGNAKIVPQRPQDTLARQYGDCKDLATLYTGLLRAAGVQADVALISSGPGMDLFPDLPCLGAFDHALVLVRGETPLWIDPTSRFSPFGELPVQDKGRFALVANETTTELARTPRGTASDNGLTSSHVITMMDTSLARITSLTTYRGAPALAMRASYASADEQQRRDWLRQNGLAELGTDKLVTFSCSDPEDLKSPFQIQTEYENAALAWAAHPQAWASVPLYEPFTWLPFDVTGPPDAAQVAAPEDETGARNERKSPLLLAYPARHEIEYRVVPAPGFTPVKWPENQTLELGPAKLEVTYRVEVDNSVTVRIVWDSGDGSFAAEAVTDTRRKIQSLGDKQGYQTWRATIQFEQTAGKALEAGRLREAVVAYHELLQKYPEDFVRHAQFAAAVLPLGLGELARTHARRAVELAPTEFYAWSTLGHVLAHNPIGQFLAPGFDRAGAADGYRKALELRPDDVAARWQLGQLLSYDERGLRYSNPEYVDAAIAELAAAYAKQKHEQLLDSLASAMYVRGKAADARKLLESEASSPTRDLHLLIGIAITESLDACVTRSAEMRPVDTERQAMLEQLVGVLSYFREYRTAAELARQVAVTSTQKDFFLLRADRLGILSRYEPEQGPLEDPTGLVRFVLANSFIHGTASSQLQRFFVNVPDEIDEAFDSGMPSWIDALRKAFLDENLPPARIADIVAEFDFSATEGGADCHRVAVTSKNFAAFSWTATVVRGEQGLRLYRPGQDQSEFGREALNLLTKGREDDARRWLDWAFDEQRQDTSTFSRIFDQFAGSSFVRLWAAGKKDQRDVQLAATALVLMGDSPEQRLLAFLAENRAELEAARQLQVDRALLEGYAKAGDYQKLSGLAATLCQKHPRTFEPAVMEMLARARLQDLDAVEDLIKKHASSVEIRVFGQLTLAEAAMAAGNAVKASEVLSALAEQKDSIPPVAITHTAWLSLFQHPVPPGTLALAKGGLEKAPPAESPKGRYLQRTASMPFVLALIDAGQFAEAVQALHAMPATDPHGRANSFDKLALGWIADKCGLHEHARKLLQEVRRSTSREPNTVYDLAQKRLELIGGAPHDDEGTAD